MVQENCFLISHHYNCIAALYCGDSPFQADHRTSRRGGRMRATTISPSKDAYHATDMALSSADSTSLVSKCTIWSVTTSS